MGKTVAINIPSWMDEDEFRRFVDVLVKRLEGRVPVEELRRRLGIRPEDLAEDATDAEASKAQERLPL